MTTAIIATMFELVRKLYCYLSGCPLVYFIYCSFIICKLCSIHPSISIYLLYAYTYKVIRNNYVSSREKLKKNRIELEDIQLQAEIVNTKLSFFEAELDDRVKSIHRQVEQLRVVRGRVSDIIVNDDGLRRLIRAVNDYDYDSCTMPNSQNQTLETLNNDLMMGLLERLIVKKEECPETDKIECCEHTESDPDPKHSDYPSMNDMDVLQDCRVKIVKVTNVYKVAYLKNHVNERWLRRAGKRALLIKKMESIKELLELWQKTLSMVTNTKLTILNIERQPLDMASIEGMGDYSKPCDTSDSDSDLRNNDSMFCEEFRVNKNEHQDCMYRECCDFGELMYQPYVQQSDFLSLHCAKTLNKLTFTEETGSQIANDEIISDYVDENCRDNVAV